MFKQGERIYFAFLNGKAAIDSQHRTRMYKSRKRFESAAPQYLIDSAKLVEYVPAVHGEWKVFEVSRYMKSGEFMDCNVYECNNCSRRTVIREKFCPNCGAKMDLDREKRNERMDKRKR